MYDLTNFTLRDMTACGAELRKLGPRAQSSEEAATAIVRHLHTCLLAGPSGGPATVLVRFFATRPFARLDEQLRTRVRALLGDIPETPCLKCLTLLGTAGTCPEWNTCEASRGHRVLPLAGAEMVLRLPMVAQLVHQFGLEVHHLLQPDPALLIDLEQRSYNVFHVADARGSPYVPAQQKFVLRYGIRSVVGFGGLLPSANLFAVILFTTVPVARETADLFRPLALSVKLAVLPFEGLPAGPA